MMSRNIDLMLMIRCKLDDEYFQDWNSLSPEIQQFWDEPENYCNCEGSGEMSTWCNDCPFCQIFEIETEDI